MEPLILTATQDAFVNSTAVVNTIFSNTGEGKTWACILAMLNHAQRCKVAGVDGPIRMAIVRDTHENIKSSIVPSIEKFFRKYYPPGTLKPRNDWKQLKIRNDPPIEVDLFGIDDLASLSR